MITPEQEEKIDQIVADIFKEIKSADDKHGNLPSNLSDCLLIIGEEFGEACTAVLESRWIPADTPDISMQEQISEIRKELIQVAAMSIATIIYGGL